ncbi:hypothetical protein T190115A13A_60163 [Tenacibaculum sp. 190524A02b]|uniref:Uncharacterized protein n=1 Tax=Tenacibaculum vairaonense TaxID=3137860 RepID=A0ABP1FHT5_9FLAO
MSRTLEELKSVWETGFQPKQEDYNELFNAIQKEKAGQFTEKQVLFLRILIQSTQEYRFINFNNKTELPSLDPTNNAFVSLNNYQISERNTGNFVLYPIKAMPQGLASLIARGAEMMNFYYFDETSNFFGEFTLIQTTELAVEGFKVFRVVSKKGFGGFTPSSDGDFMAKCHFQYIPTPKREITIQEKFTLSSYDSDKQITLDNLGIIYNTNMVVELVNGTFERVSEGEGYVMNGYIWSQTKYTKEQVKNYHVIVDYMIMEESGSPSPEG